MKEWGVHGLGEALNQRVQGFVLHSFEEVAFDPGEPLDRTRAWFVFGPVRHDFREAGPAIREAIQGERGQPSQAAGPEADAGQCQRVVERDALGQAHCADQIRTKGLPLMEFDDVYAPVGQDEMVRLRGREAGRNLEGPESANPACQLRVGGVLPVKRGHG